MKLQRFVSIVIASWHNIVNIYWHFSAQQLRIDLIDNDFDIELLISFKINVFIATNFLMEIEVLREIVCMIRLCLDEILMRNLCIEIIEHNGYRLIRQALRSNAKIDAKPRFYIPSLPLQEVQ